MKSKTTDEGYTLDGVTFYKEVPQSKVIHKDAKFFTFTKSMNGNVFFRKFAKGDALPIEFAWATWGKNSSYHEEIPLPDGLEKWTGLRYTFTPEAIEPHLSDFTVKGIRAHWFPDFGSTHLALVVSERAKLTIERLNPGNHYFFPVNITIEETGEPLPERRFYWKPRNVMRFNGTKSQKEVFKPPFRPGGAFSNREIAWDLKYNEALRDYIAKLSFWSLDQDQFNFGMSPDVFKCLKSEGFTGLVEIEGDDYAANDFDRNANIGNF